MSDDDRDIIRKAMAYDLTLIFLREPEKTYTAKELDKIIAAYIKGDLQ